MKHKLFHTLVLSGVALVEGCASTPIAPRTPGNESSEAPTSNEITAAEPTNTRVAAASSAADAAPPHTGETTVVAQPTADPVREMVADARSCSELGWVTTKTQTLALPDATIVIVGDTKYACRPRSTNQVPRCCYGWDNLPQW